MAGEISVSIGQYSSAGRKERNDDSYGVAVPGKSLLASKGVAMAIADGMSSSEAAKTASETCVRGFLEDYFGTHESWAVKTSAGRVLTGLNRWLHSQSQRQFESENALVTTFSGLILKAGMGYLFHAGDTQIAVIRAGQLDVLTQSHRVQLQRGREHLLRAVGAQPDLLVDYREVPIEDGDTLVFTTDGVHDHVPSRLVQDLVAAHAGDLNAAATAIAEAAHAAGSPDNLTCQIVRVDCAGKVDSFAYADRLQSLPFPPHLSPGMVLDGFRIVRELSASPRSQIYLAEDVETGGRVVLKTPSVNFEDDTDYIRHFIREEWVGQLINSPHVLKVLRTPRPRRFLYTLTEYVEGETLAAWMKRHPKPAIDAARGLIEQVIKGLRAFHRNDILHQDLKPDNIMIDGAGVAKIIDFGSVRIAGLEELRHGAKPALLGTMDYTAPEYLKGEAPTPRSDLYSLGVIAYEMLTGKLPYGSGFGQDKDVAKARYVPAGEHNPDIPAWVDFALERAVSISSAERYEALSHFMTDITKPSEEFQHRRRRRAFAERNPQLWLRLCLGLSVLINIALIFALKVR
jgi:serine/threonine protein phosphatase PrpC